MKLYTEEQAKYFFECGRNYQNNAEITFRVAKEEISTKPIELPTDEEIIEVSKNKSAWEYNHESNFRLGAAWMKEQILKQDKQ